MLDRNNVVSKSKQLIESKFPDWDAGTLEVFDTYLSKINPEDPDSSEVVFTKREYEQLLGVTEMRPEQLNRCIRKFMGNTVSIELKDKNGKCKGWDNYCLFDRARFEKNNSGEWVVTLRCHPELKQLFFDLKESGYQKFKLEYTLKLKYKTSKLLYYLLKDNQYRKSGIWIIELQELRERIGATAKTYNSFKDFNKFVLKRAEKEINENTDIKYTYEKIMRGGLTRAVKFIIEPPIKKYSETDNADQVPGQKNIYDYPEIIPEKDSTQQKYEFWSGACEDEFNLEQIAELGALSYPYVNYGTIEDHDVDVYYYLSLKYKALNAKNQSEIKSRYGYMKWLVENNK